MVNDASAPRQPMYYGETAPATELAPYVVAYWHFHVDPAAGEIEHVVPLDGSISLVVSHRGRGLQVVGPTTRPMITRVCGGDVARGARLSPGAGPSLLPLAPAELRDRTLAPEEHGLGEWADETATAVLDAVDQQAAARAWDRAVAALLPGSAPLDDVAMAAAAAIVAAGGNLSIRDLAAQTGLSPRQFRRRFGAAVGLSPKEFARVRRFRTSLVGALGENERRWAEIAAGFGFADQMHLIREYRRASGRTPGRLLGHLETIDHGPVLDR